MRKFVLAVAIALGLIPVLALFALVFREETEELIRTLRSADWLAVAFVLLIATVVILPRAMRSRRMARIWNVFVEPFEKVSYPGNEIDFDREAYGLLLLDPKTKFRGIRAIVDGSGLNLRKAFSNNPLGSFRIPWSMISTICYTETLKDEGSFRDGLGAARITMKFAEELVVIVPWRGNFCRHVGDGIGYRESQRLIL